MTLANDTESYLCALVARALGENAIGSAGKWPSCLLIEVPTPWARDAVQSAHFPQSLRAVLSNASAGGVTPRVQGLVPDPEYSVEGHTRVLYARKPEVAFARYDRDEFLVPTHLLSQLADALLLFPAELPRFEEFRQDSAGIRDILVCTHGNRDACCAKFGVSIYQALRQKYAPASQDRLRVWRTSHTGGHRFAPTLVDLPEGRCWGYVQPDMLEHLVLRNGPVSDLRGSYRGWCMLGSAFEQVAECAAFMKEGWAWATYLKTSRLRSVAQDGSRADVRIEFTCDVNDHIDAGMNAMFTINPGRGF
jgi:hypothetical protein